tara:strand:- start:764 stop:1144 length:381 start_codon:yes stop_codon:yes gene_type:complete
MDYWHDIEDTPNDGPFNIQISYRYSDERLEDIYPDDTPEQIREQYDSLEKHDSSLFDVRVRYIYNNDLIFSDTYLHSLHYDGFPEDAIMKGLDGEIEMMMIEGKEEAIKKAKNLLDSLQKYFEEQS